ncbi:hypothetical protein GOP47_0024179 [Adiantum capillus-veneris]|uniref:Uncharacterized protein n=1 Tax=Adiantum capillus-veneris TaxID=13818 RepID=A0A9D4Z551_ADICA|nr:hypothetical protein GOP47_0024179 [Adiantum capillus-veneris]
MFAAEHECSSRLGRVGKLCQAFLGMGKKPISSAGMLVKSSHDLCVLAIGGLDLVNEGRCGGKGSWVRELWEHIRLLVLDLIIMSLSRMPYVRSQGVHSC